MTAGVLALIVVVSMTGCAVPVQHAPVSAPGGLPGHADVPAAGSVSATPVLDLGAMPELADIIPRLAEKRVVYIGEKHDDYGHHLTQLEIIRRLHARQPRLAIGMEAFQQPYQPVLDDYIAGRLGEREMLRASEYFTRWRFDFRHYAPILRYAREHKLPVVALSLPAELTGKVAREGVAALSEAERAQLPDEIDRSDKDYELRLKRVFDRHPGNGRGFDRFLEVQLLWDEGMAQRSADYLAAHPGERMVILAGSGHIALGSGIPRRLARRLPVDSATVLNEWHGDLQPEPADFVLLTQSHRLPPAGQLGVFLEDGSSVPTVEHCMPDSPCSQAGLKPGDRFLSIAGEPVTDMTELRLAMWDRQPGDTVELRVSRERWFSAPQELSYSVVLR